MAASSSARVRTVAAALAGALVGVVALAAVIGLGHRAPPAPPRVPEAPVTAGRLARARAALVHRAPPSQQAALADGRVAPAEYRSAVARSMGCLARALAGPERRQGVRPAQFRGPTWSDDRYTVAYSYAVTARDVDVRRLDRTCQWRHSRRIEALFHLQYRNDPTAMARSARRFHACLDAAHLPGRSTDPPRARFRAVITSPKVRAAQAVDARICIGTFPSIGDLDP